MQDNDLTDAVWVQEGDNRMTHSKILEERLTSAYRTSGLFAPDAPSTRYTSKASSDALSSTETLKAEVIPAAEEAFPFVSKSVSRRRLLMK